MTSQTNDYLFIKTQKYFNWFAFFLPIGMVKIAGVSITFFIFLIIVYIFLKNKKKIFKINKYTDYLFILLFILLFISLIFAEDTFREINTVFLFKISMQYIYWFTLAMFVKTWIHKYNFLQLSKYLFYGLLGLIFYKYAINPIALLYRDYIGYLPRNTFTYFVVITAPLALYYTYNKFSIIKNIIISFGIFIFTAISQSRTGTALVFLEIAILLSSAKPYIKRKVIIFSFLILPFIGLGWTHMSDTRVYIGDLIEPINPRMALMIKDPERLNTLDKSWLIRKLMVQKGLRLFEEHPFLGIGLGHFKYYWTDLDIQSEQLYMGLESYNKRSSHNSYIKTLAESGIFALLSLIMLQLIIIFKGFKYVAKMQFTAKIFIYTSFIGMSIYWYVISAITGAIPWFMVGLGMAMIQNKEIK